MPAYRIADIANRIQTLFPGALESSWIRDTPVHTFHDAGEDRAHLRTHVVADRDDIRIEIVSDSIIASCAAALRGLLVPLRSIVVHGVDFPAPALGIRRTTRCAKDRWSRGSDGFSRMHFLSKDALQGSRYARIRIRG